MNKNVTDLLDGGERNVQDSKTQKRHHKTAKARATKEGDMQTTECGLQNADMQVFSRSAGVCDAAWVWDTCVDGREVQGGLAQSIIARSNPTSGLPPGSLVWTALDPGL